MPIADPHSSASASTRPNDRAASPSHSGTRTLTLIRHAKSSWKQVDLPDHDRPLKGRGRRDVARMAERLRERGFAPDSILTSTALRARATARAIAEACGLEDRIEASRDLYHAEPMQLLEALERHCRRAGAGWTHVALVGHNPGSSELLEWLTHAGAGDLPTCAVATVECPCDSFSLRALREGESRLVRLETPKGERQAGAGGSGGGG